jgi:hypothetical protein
MDVKIIGNGDSNHFLKLIREKSDDFSEAVLVAPGWRVAANGVPVSPVLEKTILLLVKANGGYIPVPADHDMELILNDGILERMRIPIRDANAAGDPLVPMTLIPPASSTR